jgi:predicted amidophosphoribosyltransferase
MRGPVRGARIALVDDVMTTGATLAEASRTLLAAGAEQVECWVVARTLPP